MNKEDLIKKYESLEGVWNANGAEIARQCFLRDLEQLNEIDTKKVTIPQFMADWYEEYKDDFEGSLFRCIDCIPSLYDEGDLNDLEEWIIDCETKPFQTLVNMHQFGYTVEKEKRYRISMPKARNYKNHAQILCEEDGKMFWCGEWYRFKTKFTQKELEEVGFGWVFDCPGIEIEEVEE